MRKDDFTSLPREGGREGGGCSEREGEIGGSEGEEKKES